MGKHPDGKLVLGLGAVGLLLLFLLTRKKEQPGPEPIITTLSGIVTDGADSPLEGVLVTLFRGSTNYTALTNTNGNYLISSIQAGNYQLSFAKSGYSFIIGQITIFEGENTVDAILSPEFDLGLIMNIYDSYGNRVV